MQLCFKSFVGYCYEIMLLALVFLEVLARALVCLRIITLYGNYGLIIIIFAIIMNVIILTKRTSKLIVGRHLCVKNMSECVLHSLYYPTIML